MSYSIMADRHRVHVFHEGRKRRMFVGELIYHPKQDRYEFIYDEKYINYKSAIPLGPELSLFQLHHLSEKGKLFPSLHDRIPSKSNPAYSDYCHSQGIASNENNMIILLGTIGRRGPSSFIFEPVYAHRFNIDNIKKFRRELNITQNDFAIAFDLSKVTLQRIESGSSHDPSTLKCIQIFFTFPEVALWQLHLTGARVHKDTLTKLIKHFEEKNAISNNTQ